MCLCICLTSYIANSKKVNMLKENVQNGLIVVYFSYF